MGIVSAIRNLSAIFCIVSLVLIIAIYGLDKPLLFIIPGILFVVAILSYKGDTNSGTSVLNRIENEITVV